MHLDVPGTYLVDWMYGEVDVSCSPHFALLSPSCACCLLHLPPCLFASFDCRWVQVSRRQWRMSTIRRFFFIVATMKTKKVLAGAVLSQKTPTATNCYSLRSASCGQLWAMSIEKLDTIVCRELHGSTPRDSWWVWSPEETVLERGWRWRRG